MPDDEGPRRFSAADPPHLDISPTLPAPSVVVAAAPVAAATVLENRYRLIRKIGEGSFGDVWEAYDQIVGEHVALKWLRTSRGAMESRVRREITTLRLLRFPGVSRLLDDGVSDDKPFLVMELIHGRPFPGDVEQRPLTWAEIAGPTLALLETLSHVHAAGVIHRDLKPANVLVCPDGRTVVVDFGVSLPAALGVERRKRGGLRVGSPQYMSSEQISGDDVDARTDLYAVGVMLYELVTRQVPHDAENIVKMFRLRLSKPVRPVQELAPTLPSAVASVINRLLETDKKDRFDSAADVLAALRGEAMTAQTVLPYLGPQQILSDIASELAAGHSVFLEGVSGSGRTRCMREVATLLEQWGRKVQWIPSSREPLGSLLPAVDEPENIRDLRSDEALDWAEQAVAKQSARGIVLFADDAEALDPWSSKVLFRKLGKTAAIFGSFVTAPKDGLAPKTFQIPLLDEASLRALFVGPDRLFHLREDAAYVLFGRTNGHAGQVATELSSWTRMGLARHVGQMFAVDRSALDRLRTGLEGAHLASGTNLELAVEDDAIKEMLQWLSLANCALSREQLVQLTGYPPFRVEAMAQDCVGRGWITTTATQRYQIRWRQAMQKSEEQRREAHGRIAVVLEAGEDMRLYHFLAAGLLKQAAEESLVAASKQATAGNTGTAIALLAEGLRAARDDHGLSEERRVLVLWAKTALDNGSARAIDRTLYEISRVRIFDTELKRVETLLRAAIMAPGAGGMQALDMVDVLGKFADPELERWRHRIRIAAVASRASASLIADVLHDIEDWADESEDVLAQLSLAEGRGRQRYHEGQFEDAAAWYGRAADFEISTSARMAAMLRSASALLEAFRYADAMKMAKAAQRLAAEYRNPLWEGRAEWVLRSVQYRTGQTSGADTEFIEAVKLVGTDDLEALVCLNEAAAAMRMNELSFACELAERAATNWRTLGRPYATMLARAVAIACGATVQQDELDTLIARARECTGIGIGIQTLGLLGKGVPEKRLSWTLSDLRPMCFGISLKHWHERMDVLSLAEAWEWATGTVTANPRNP